MTTTEAMTAYIDRLRHRAAQMNEQATEMRDEATDRKARADALDGPGRCP